MLALERFCFFLGHFSLQKKSEDNRYLAMRRAGLLSTVPFLLAASPIIGFYMGRFLDVKFGTDPTFSIIFLILGFVAGAVQVAKIIKLANREPDKKE
jgi:F0F1-type ATP synthase assembly protein I